MNTDKDKLKAFKGELKDLLKKYEANISFTCADCSDLHGVYDERISVSFTQPLQNGHRWRVQGNPHTLSDGYHLNQSDL